MQVVWHCLPKHASPAGQSLLTLQEPVLGPVPQRATGPAWVLAVLQMQPAGHVGQHPSPPAQMPLQQSAPVRQAAPTAPLQTPLRQQVPLRQTDPVVPQTHCPLRQVSARLLLQLTQAVPKPLVPQIAVPDNAVQVPLRQVVLVQVLLTLVSFTQLWPEPQTVWQLLQCWRSLPVSTHRPSHSVWPCLQPDGGFAAWAWPAPIAASTTPARPPPSRRSA